VTLCEPDGELSTLLRHRRAGLTPAAGPLEADGPQEGRGDRVGLSVNGTPGVSLGASLDPAVLDGFDIAEIPGCSIELAAERLSSGHLGSSGSVQSVYYT
jgi:hypothetical protein